MTEPKRCKYLNGANEVPLNAKRLRELIGTKVAYLRGSDIDRTGRGYFFPRSGTIIGVEGRNVELDNGGWMWVKDFVELTTDPAALEQC